MAANLQGCLSHSCSSSTRGHGHSSSNSRFAAVGNGGRGSGEGERGKDRKRETWGEREVRREGKIESYRDTCPEMNGRGDHVNNTKQVPNIFSTVKKGKCPHGLEDNILVKLGFPSQSLTWACLKRDAVVETLKS
ncbi:uncharacterized protein J3R85_015153 [Psidium guajava]|nr:uncharacterized protein J3R85_015153 [Psidium guajava]